MDVCRYINDEVLERLYKKCQVDAVSGCWNWQGKVSAGGYGTIGITFSKGIYKNIGVHRLSYIAFYGDFEDTLLVCHHCDNRICINPDHLFLGTDDDNNKDKMRKGRCRRGENHPNSKLTTSDVLFMRENYSSGKFNQVQLAELFGINQTTVSDIVKNKYWKRLD